MNAYHYTVGTKLAAIQASGALRPTAIKIGPGERPLLWFSRNPVYEPTARKIIMDSKGERLATFNEMLALCGVYRFALPVSDPRLISWSDIPRVARMSLPTAVGLIRTGIEWNAVPSDWMGTLDPVPLSALTFEKFCAGWQPSTLNEAIETTPARKHRILSAVAA